MAFLFKLETADGVPASISRSRRAEEQPRLTFPFTSPRCDEEKASVSGAFLV
jgi:hypothetical protein